MATGQEPATEALRLLYPDLVEVLQEPHVIACELYSAGIVPRIALEHTTTVQGITDTEKRIRLLGLVDAAKLPEFVEILKKRSPTVEMAERLEKKYCECPSMS